MGVAGRIAFARAELVEVVVGGDVFVGGPGLVGVVGAGVRLAAHLLAFGPTARRQQSGDGRSGQQSGLTQPFPAVPVQALVGDLGRGDRRFGADQHGGVLFTGKARSASEFLTGLGERPGLFVTCDR